MRPQLTPCLICEKAIMYLWGDEHRTESTNLNGAADVMITAWYGSNFDMNQYHALICDQCIDAAIQSKRIRFIKEHPPFG